MGSTRFYCSIINVVCLGIVFNSGKKNLKYHKTVHNMSSFDTYDKHMWYIPRMSKLYNTSLKIKCETMPVHVMAMPHYLSRNSYHSYNTGVLICKLQENDVQFWENTKTPLYTFSLNMLISSHIFFINSVLFEIKLLMTCNYTLMQRQQSKGGDSTI